MKGEQLLGLIAVNGASGGRPCNRNGLPIVAEYAREALRAFEEVDSARGDRMLEVELSNLESLLVTKTTPQDALKTLIEVLLSLTGAQMCHIRYRNGNFATLLPIFTGDYGRFAPTSIPLSEREFPAIRVLLSGQALGFDRATRDPSVINFRNSLPEKARRIIKKFDSYWIEPLIFQNRCIGSLGLYHKKENYFDPSKKNIAGSVAERIALAVHDYVVSLNRNKEEDERVALDARKDLAIRAVHNIRNPATAIHTYLTVLLRDFTHSSEVEDILFKIETQIIRIENLAKDFLRYLAPFKSRAIPVDLRHLIREVVNRYSFTESNVTLKLDLEEVPRVVGDEEGLAWVVEELLSNAVKMGAKTINIVLRQSADQARISFLNDGVGVPDDIRKQMFEPFYSSDVMGTGLGLATAKRIIEEHGGSIRLATGKAGAVSFEIGLPS